ncbi:MAG: Rieske (2Fe-2S) protein [Gammaproteobacteria bacterium]|nr:MAG: Rieske (2Fe-2S) protein [Gammaproteobacteria bacterium]
MAPQINDLPDSSFRRILRQISDLEYEKGFALPGAFYTDSQWLQIEREQLFLRDWFCVGRIEEVSQPGDYFSFDQVGEPILIVHGRDGVIRALANVCRHRGTVIASGSGNSKKFLCPYHHWAYDSAFKCAAHGVAPGLRHEGLSLEAAGLRVLAGLHIRQPRSTGSRAAGRARAAGKNNR